MDDQGTGTLLMVHGMLMQWQLQQRAPLYHPTKATSNSTCWHVNTEASLLDRSTRGCIQLRCLALAFQIELYSDRGV